MGHGGKSAQRLRDSKQGVRVLQPDQGAEALLQSGVPMVVGAWPTGRPALLAINPAARHAQGQIRSKTGEGSLHAASVESKHLAHGGWGGGFPSLLLAASCAACRRMGVSCPALAVLVMLSRCPNTYFYAEHLGTGVKGITMAGMRYAHGVGLLRLARHSRLLTEPASLSSPAPAPLLCELHPEAL